MNKSTGDFIDYEEATFDPGFSFIIVSFIACLLLNVTLPCLVSLGGRYERRRNETNNKISQKASEDSVDGSRNVFQVGRVLQAITEDAPIEKRDESTATPAPPKMEKFEPHRPAKQKENSSAAGFFALCFGVGRSGGASANVTDFLSGFADSVSVLFIRTSVFLHFFPSS